MPQLIDIGNDIPYRDYRFDEFVRDLDFELFFQLVKDGYCSQRIDPQILQVCFQREVRRRALLFPRDDLKNHITYHEKFLFAPEKK